MSGRTLLVVNPVSLPQRGKPSSGVRLTSSGLKAGWSSVDKPSHQSGAWRLPSFHIITWILLVAGSLHDIAWKQRGVFLDGWKAGLRGWSRSWLSSVEFGLHPGKRKGRPPEQFLSVGMHVKGGWQIKHHQKTVHRPCLPSLLFLDTIKKLTSRILIFPSPYVAPGHVISWRTLCYLLTKAQLM
jgi:hypothetical protein